MALKDIEIKDKVEEPVVEKETKKKIVTKTPSVEEPLVDFDLDMSAIRRKRIRVNGDFNKIIELNLSDMFIEKRLNEQYQKLREYMEEVIQLSKNPDNSDEALMDLSIQLTDIDKKMRECIDTIFNFPVCDVLAPDGSMFDPFNGTFRFEYILNALTSYYESNLNSEYNKMKANVNKTTSKYTKNKR